MGRHLAKSNLDVEGKKIIITSTIVLGLIFGSTIYDGVNNTKNNQELPSNFETPSIPIVANISELSVLEQIDAIASNYPIYQNSNDLNTIGLTIQFIKNFISDSNLTDNERIDILNSLKENPNLLDELITYINSNSQNIIYYDESKIDLNSLYTVLQDERLMAEISKGETDYKMPESILVGIAANRMGNKDLARTNRGPGGVSLGISESSGDRSAHNFRTGKDDKIKDFPSIGAALSACVKESDKSDKYDLYRDLDSALTIFYAGPDNKDTAIEQFAIQNKNNVLSYTSQYLKDKRIVIHYTYNASEYKDATITFESSNYQEFVEQTLNGVLNQIDINILQSYDQGIIR